MKHVVTFKTLPSDPELCEKLKNVLPRHIEVSLKATKPPRIEIHDGLWRGILLQVSHYDDHIELGEEKYLVPGIGGKLILMIISFVLATILLMIFFLSVGVDVSTLVIYTALTVIIYSLLSKGLINYKSKTWSPELQQAIEKLND